VNINQGRKIRISLTGNIEMNVHEVVKRFTSESANTIFATEVKE